MLRIANLALSRGSKRLLDNASLAVHDRHKVGVVGANGSGKSSLFAAIRGEIVPDAGSIDLPPRWTLAHVAQETPAVASAAIEYVLDGDRELRDVERALRSREPTARCSPSSIIASRRSAGTARGRARRRF